MTSIEETIHVDLGNRGLESLFLASKGELQKACSHLFNKSKSIGILTGFNLPPIETDGPLGAAALYDVLLEMGKTVSLISDDHCKAMLESMSRPFNTFSNDINQCEQLASLMCQKIDTLVSIEVCGPAKDGRLYRMSGKDCTENQIYGYKFYELAVKNPNITTIAIADGGNELGCGKYYEQLLVSAIPHIEKIGCVLPSDYCIFSGVSNWGAWGLCYQLSLLSPSISNLPTVENQRELLRKIVDAGAEDPRHGRIMAVDGMMYENEHVKVLQSIAHAKSLMKDS